MSATIVFHTALAILAVPLGLMQFTSKKGTQAHRIIGRIWIGCLALVSTSAMFIQALNPGSYSIIHLLVPFTLIMLGWSLWSIRQYKHTGSIRHLAAHKRTMIGVYVGALMVAGGFALMPGRAIYEILFR